jgi:hypothetical protein
MSISGSRMNPEHKQYKFKYKVEGKTAMSGWGKWGTAVSFITIAAVSIPFLFFLYRGFTGEKEFYIIAAVFAILILLVGPYQFWIKGYYFLGLTTDGTLIMRSVLNFIPKSFEIKVSDISEMKQDNIAKSPAVLFYDKSNKLIGKFNPLTMKYTKFLSYVEELMKINPDIKFSFKGFDKINDDSKY